MEIKEAFSVLDVSDSGTVSVKELRAVMLACCDTDVRFAEGKKMIEAASRTGEKGAKATIKFEEFESIIHWVCSISARQIISLPGASHLPLHKMFKRLSQLSTLLAAFLILEPCIDNYITLALSSPCEADVSSFLSDAAAS